jgi:uncharacterized tellurite resistance protein B-like protein
MNQERIGLISNWVGQWTGEDQAGNELGNGSCWPVADDLVVTNYHVMTIGPKASVTIHNYGRFPVIGVVAVDQPRDLAVAKLRMGNKRLSPLTYCEDLPRQGSDVYVFGNPQGLQNTVTRGIIGAIRRTEELSGFGYTSGRSGDLLLQLDAAINPGSSGGPIINSRGAVVGVTALSVLQSQGLNFGIPCCYVAELLDLAQEPEPIASFPRNPEHAALQSVSATSTDAVAPQTELFWMRILDTLVLLRAMALIDGFVSDSEGRILTDHLDFIATALGVSSTELLPFVQVAVNTVDERGPGPAAVEAMQRLRQLSDPDLRAVLARMLLQIVQADGWVAPAETTFLTAVMQCWNDIDWAAQ